ncbi:glucan biosynthesis protein [Rhodomicrobium vannielii ATCC 17100]|uniref:glucan biosynthesis protein n=1 Tax=Rhodomicrobium vannielii TaxID=1069 RepID=UPI0019193B0B|nr:glucan biosynthesis protein [Rhodomicrobium vannielii]MBJ7535631.1 glucan biosynthesis protein [Rhodomicrobium vannielii ATCC 17100]
MDRRDVLKLGAGFAAALYFARHADVIGEARADDGEPFSFATLVERARQLSLSPYAPPADTIPENYKDLNYDQYRDIRFKREDALWANDNLGFTAEFFSAGYLYATPVQIFTVANGRATELKYRADLFTYGQNVTPPPEGTAPGFSGFRIHTPIDKAYQMDEFAVFQGASYFRAKATGQGYGLSARGLAIDTARPPHDEFPVFRAFWIVRPESGASSVTVFALLDSISVSGAYKFVISARANTVMDVDCTLFPRKTMAHAGIAPLTSMFYFAPSTSYRADEVRNRVHDSDGLAIWNGKGEHIWRPLINSPRVQFSSFVDDAVRGFGLVQRERRGDRYEDFEAHYEQRPSLWVEPRESFGKGSVDLVELPTTTEYFDNIVAYWHPKEPLAAGASYAYKYRLTWCDAPPLRINYATVAQTLVGASLQNAGRRLFNIDFAGTEEFNLCDDSDEFCGDKSRTMELTASAGTIVNATIRRNRVSGGHRVAFEYEPAAGSDEADLRCGLLSDGKPISEVWIYRWTA